MRTVTWVPAGISTAAANRLEPSSMTTGTSNLAIVFLIFIRPHFLAGFVLRLGALYQSQKGQTRLVLDVNGILTCSGFSVISSLLKTEELCVPGLWYRFFLSW